MRAAVFSGRSQLCHLLLLVGPAAASDPSSFSEPVVRNAVSQIIRLVGVSGIESDTQSVHPPVDEEALLPPITVLRKLLSKVDPPIDEVIGSGVVPSLVAMLAPAFGYTLRTEAAWAITNIASGTAEHTSTLIRLQATRPLVAALSEGLVDESGRELTGSDLQRMATRVDMATLGQPQGVAPPDELVFDGTADQEAVLAALHQELDAAEANGQAPEETPLEAMRAQAAWAVANLVADTRASMGKVPVLVRPSPATTVSPDCIRRLGTCLLSREEGASVSYTTERPRPWSQAVPNSPISLRFGHPGGPTASTSWRSAASTRCSATCASCARRTPPPYEYWGPFPLAPPPSRSHFGAQTLSIPAAAAAARPHPFGARALSPRP